MDRKTFLRTTVTLVSGLSLTGFKGMRGPDRNIRFGMITDLHYADREPTGGGTRYYSQSLNKLEECISVMNKEKVDFLIQLGDFKDQNEPPDEKSTLEYLERINNTFSKFDGPAYHVLGNHDHDSISKQQFLDRIAIPEVSKKSGYYSFDAGGFHFVVLDANYISSGEEYGHGNFDWKDANVPEEQLIWLENDLDSTRNPTVVFIHQKLDEKEGNQNYCVRNAAIVRERLNASGKVLMVLQGHYHPGETTRMGDILYYTLPAAVEGDGMANNHYAILEINSNLEVNLTGYRKTPSVVFE